MLSGFFLAFLAARLALVPLAAALPPFPLLAMAMAGAGVMAGLIAVGGPVWLFIPMGGFAGLFFPAFYMAGAVQMGQDPRVSSLLIAAGMAGGISAPLVLGLVMGASGAGSFFALISVLVGGAAVLATLSLRGWRARRWPERGCGPASGD